MRTLCLFFAGLAAGLVCLSFVEPVAAQCHSARVVRTHYQPAIRVQHVRHVQHVQERVVVKRVVAFDAVPQYYYSVGDAYQQSLLADAVAYRVQQGLLAAQAAYAQQAVQVAPQQAYQGQHQKATGHGHTMDQECIECPPGGGGIANQIQVVPQNQSWKTRLAGVVKNSCLACHAGQNGIDLSDLNSVSAADRGACYSAVKYGAMPKGHGKLPAASIELFRLWKQQK